jgi:hypothetical protein
MWGLSLGVCYLLFLRHLSADQNLLSYWNFSFPPSHLFSVAGVEWFATTFFAIFQNPVGLELSGIAAFAFLVGCSAMVSVKRQTLAILISPVLVTLLAASFHKYPFSGRLLLFAVPALLIPIAERRGVHSPPDQRPGAGCRGLSYWSAFLLPFTLLQLSPV